MICISSVVEEFRLRTIWSFSNAFTSAFKELDPIPQFKATAKLGEFLEAGFFNLFEQAAVPIGPPLHSQWMKLRNQRAECGEFLVYEVKTAEARPSPLSTAHVGSELSSNNSHCQQSRTPLRLRFDTRSPQKQVTWRW